MFVKDQIKSVTIDCIHTKYRDDLKGHQTAQFDSPLCDMQAIADANYK